MNLYEKIKMLCKEREISIAKLESELGFGNGSIRKWGNAAPATDRLEKVADYFHVSTDYLLNREDKKIELNARDEKDIAKSLERIMDNLENGEALAYGGEVPEEDKELYRVAIQGALEMIKIKNKERFTPKKYR